MRRHESKLTAVIKSGTIQRGAAIVATGTLPVVPLVNESGSLEQWIASAKHLSAQGQEIKDTVNALQTQADSLMPYLTWLPWAAGGWTALLLLIFAMLVQRYLRDRGYLT